MGDALSLGELRAIVFAVCTLSFFAALISWMPFDSGVGAREKVEASSEVFRGLSMIKYSDFVSFNLTIAGGSFTNNTGGHDWEMSWELQGDTDCINVEWLWFHEFGGYYEDMHPLDWYDKNGNKVSITGGGLFYCYERLLGGQQKWINSAVLDLEYDTATGLSAFTISGGPVNFDVFFGFTGSYTTPSQAWVAGALQCLIGVTPDHSATQQSGIAMIFGLLTFQQIEGIPDYMGYLFSAFLWILISVIVMALVSRFIPFL